MNDQQVLTIALTTLPTMITVLIGILINNARLGDVNSRIGDLNSRLNETNSRISETNSRIGETNSRIGELRADMNLRFDEVKVLWRSELHRVEEILDARLKHIEQR
jgi:cell division protein FtsL